MRRIWYLSTCSTSKRILNELNGLSGFEKWDLKLNNISQWDLDLLARKAGTYEALFNRRSKKYTEWGLKDKILNEKDYRELILKEYTMLKRPVILDEQELFIGNDEKTIAKAKAFIL